MKAADVMTRGEGVVTVFLPGTCDDVLEYLQERGFSSVPVIKETDEETKYRGLIFREDLVKHSDEDQLAVFVHEVPAASADDDLEAVAATMVSEDTRRIPVIDGDAIEGILTIAGVVRAITRDDISGETEASDIATRDVNTTYVDASLHIVEHEIFYANTPYAVVLDGEASLAGIMTEVDIIKVACAVEGEADTDGSVANQDDEWMWEDIKAVGNRYIPTQNVEIPARPVSKFITDDLVSVITRTTAKDATQTMIHEDIKQIPLVSGDELIDVIRDINLLEAPYE